MNAAFDRISIDPTVCGGKPCIRGMRFPVYQIVDLVAGGNSFSSILSDYPFLEEEDIQQALAYASMLAHEEWCAHPRSPANRINPQVITRAEYALQVLSREATIEGAYLFGSQVKGNTHEWSDIDIAAFVENSETWDIFERADRTAYVQKEAGDEIELHFFPADQLAHPEPSSFAEYILRTGVRLETPAPASPPSK